MLHFSQSISFKFHSNVLCSRGLLAAGKLYVALSLFSHHKPRVSTQSLIPCASVPRQHAFFRKKPGKLAILWKFRTLKMSLIAHLLHFSQLF
jgi:hypothetical protein